MKDSAATIDEASLDGLRAQWADLTGRYGAAGPAAEAFADLARRYSEKGRAYHTLRHVRELLALLEEAPGGTPRDRDAARFAVWFHDAVYDTHRDDNEARSADLADATLARLGVPEGIVTDVRRMVLATKTHDVEGLSEAGRLFLDADLAILGAPEAVYRAYRAAIRTEYAWVPAFLYRRSRRTVLRSFLDRPAIYHTDTLRDRFEAQARRNLRDEIATLV
jgi:predicted metal-dependent HD superfamily phosphohydrolase